MRKKEKRATSRSVMAILLAGAALSSVAHAFELDSPDVAPNEAFAEKFVFSGMGCTGGNVSPALRWSEPPAGTKSFVLMVHDPDAPTGGAGIWHWVIVDIPADARSLEQGAGTKDGTKLPEGSRPMANDYAGFGISPAYGGPCPPKGSGVHHYHFMLYALGVDKLDLPPAATASQVGFVTIRNALGKAEMVVPYGR